MTDIKNDKEFETEVNSSNYTVVDFYADWCVPCKMLDRIMPKIEDAFSDNSAVSFKRVDTDALSDLASKYEVMTIPTMIVFHSGNIINRRSGFGRREAIIEFIKDSI